MSTAFIVCMHLYTCVCLHICTEQLSLCTLSQYPKQHACTRTVSMCVHVHVLTDFLFLPDGWSSGWAQLLRAGISVACSPADVSIVVGTSTLPQAHHGIPVLAMSFYMGVPLERVWITGPFTESLLRFTECAGMRAALVVQHAYILNAPC